MKQTLIALIRDTFAGQRADAQRSEPQQDQRAATIRTLDLAELHQVAGGDEATAASPKRGW